ncbi:hypothetical protein GL279_11470 [Paracoccus limosus]|jgi:AcrR family transcriptional regulator|uniref:Tetracyclin repressor-like C-terminal domain-containing protein n=1 Tax=Paracoccus limosus TaxID=913252 RepID=A0A844H317_9RHOB|nr:TetR/AcrR family transcriptional regulator [Paracoccus limosus]MTH35222.1 hypothetical protein [Paracoccus limosus]
MSDPGNLYQNLIKTAKTAVEKQGALPSSLDDLAALAGVAPQEVRACFATLDDLREGVIYDSVMLLNDALRQGIIESDPHSPDAQLRSLARSYGDWAYRHPRLFAMLVDGLMGDLPTDSTLYRFTISIRQLFERKLHEMIDIGMLDKTADIDRIILFLHCLIRGANVVFVGRGTDPWTKDDERPGANLAEDVFDQFLDGIIAQHGPKAAG